LEGWPLYEQYELPACLAGGNAVAADDRRSPAGTGDMLWLSATNTLPAEFFRARVRLAE
jgi:hypothetical protein